MSVTKEYATASVSDNLPEADKSQEDNMNITSPPGGRSLPPTRERLLGGHGSSLERVLCPVVLGVSMLAQCHRMCPHARPGVCREQRVLQAHGVPDSALRLLGRGDRIQGPKEHSMSWRSQDMKSRPHSSDAARLSAHPWQLPTGTRWPLWDILGAVLQQQLCHV